MPVRQAETMKWRMTLSFLATIAALGLAILAHGQLLRLGMIEQGTHYRGSLVLNHDASLMGPPAQGVSYCLNMPALVVSNFVHGHLMSYNEAFHDQAWFPFHGFFEYYLCVFILWWCIGWYLDRRAIPRSLLPGLAATLLVLLLSLDLMYIGSFSLRGGWLARSLQISSVLWGLILAVLSINSAYGLIRQRRGILETDSGKV